MTLTLSSEIFWTEAVLVALVDLGVVFVLIWRIKPAQFRALKWEVTGVSGIAWGIFAVALLELFWDLYYRFIFPDVMRWLAFSDALIYAGIGLGMWWLSCRVPGNPVANFCFLGGIDSVLEHVWGIYGLGILDKVPLLQGAAPLPVLVFAFFEYILYWGIVLAIATMLSRVRQAWTHSQGRTVGA